MKRIHILGRKNHGKTTLIVELVEWLAERGYRVGTIKHTHHAHELDTPGKDSHRHRLAGAQVVGILSQTLSAVYWQPLEPRGLSDPAEGRYAEFAPHFAACDLVLVEGDAHATALKVEVWRQAAGSPPLAADDPTIAAVISDDPLELAAPVWPRRDIAATAAGILRLAGLSEPSPPH